MKLLIAAVMAFAAALADPAAAVPRKADALHPYPAPNANRVTGDDWGQRMPDLIFFDEAGKQKRLSDFRGKIVLVNLWASWCPPCIREVPSLQRLQEKYAGKDLVVLLLNRWENYETGVKWARERGFTVPLYRSGEKSPARHDNTEIPTADGRTYVPAYATIPTNVIVGRGGTVIARLPALNWDDLHAVMDDVLANAPAD